MGSKTGKLRQVIDWSAAVWAGVIAGVVFLLLNLFLTPSIEGGNAWVMLRLLASVALGDRVLAPPATFDAVVLVVALLVHFAVSIGASLLLAAIIHRWGLAVGILGGALFGFMLYCVNFYTMTLLFPWFFAMRTPTLVVTHVIFGAVAGGAYEGLEVEEYEPV